MAALNEYLALITSEHATKPKYIAYVNAFLEKLDAIIEVYGQFNILFNLNKNLPETVNLGDPEPGSKLSLVDDQLDKLGQLLGLGRSLPIVDPDIPVVLNNEQYQKVLKAKVYSDHWDGTIEGLFKILEAVYPDLGYDIVDNQDMSYDVLVIDPAISDTDKALLFNGFILPKPVGVGVGYTIITDPYFGWDANTAIIQGWEQGIWRSK